MRSIPSPPFGPKWLQDKTRQLLQLLSLQERRRLREYLVFRGSARWGSSCSGTESPAFCLRALWDVLLEEDPRCKLPHVHTVVSCEKEPQKRDFIEKVAPFRAEVSYGDIFDLAKTSPPWPLDTRTQLHVKPNLTDLLLYITGFSCRTVSGLNCASVENAIAVSEGLGSTGETLQGVLNALSLWQPLLCILENVLGLRRNGHFFGAGASEETRVCGHRATDRF